MRYLDVPIAAQNLIDLVNPVNWEDDLNKGLLFWALNLPELSSGGNLIDLVSQLPGLLVGQGSGTGFQPAINNAGKGSLKSTGSFYVNYGTPNNKLANLATASTGFTISFWAVYSSLTKSTIVARSDSNVNSGWLIGYNTSGAAFGLNIVCNINNQISSIAAPTVNVPFHITITFAGGQLASAINTYKNGILQSTIFTQNGSGSQGSDLTQNLYLLNSQPFGIPNASVDDLRISNRVYNTSEVLRGYNQSLTGNPSLLKRRKLFNLTVVSSFNVTDTLTLSESSNDSYYTNLLPITDTLTVTDSLQTIGGILGFASTDNLTFTESQNYLETSYIFTVDDLILSESAYLVQSILKLTTTDTLTFSESTNSIFYLQVIVKDTLVTTESLISVTCYTINITDTITTTDILSIYTPNSTHFLAFTDNLLLADFNFINITSNRLFTDKLILESNVQGHKLFNETVTQTISFSQIVRRGANLSLTQSITLVQPALIQNTTHYPTLSQQLIFNQSINRNILHNISVNQNILFQSIRNTILPFNGNLINVSYPGLAVYHSSTCLVILQSKISSIVLPCPLFDDTQNLTQVLTIKRAMTGTKRVYIKPNSRNKILYTFRMDRQKSLEFRQFYLDNFVNTINQITMTNFKGETWIGYITIDPTFVKKSRWANCGDEVNIAFEFEGYRVQG